MTKRIFRSVFLAAAAVLLVSLLVVMGVLGAYFTRIQHQHLQGQMTLAAQGLTHGGSTYLVELPGSACRITWVDSNGTVLYDSMANAADMENHLQREEIRQALAGGAGESTRYSDTLQEKTLYLARLLPDGTVLRLASTQDTVVAWLLGMTLPLLLVLAGALLLSALLARRLARHIMGPLNALDPEHPLDNDAYEELSPLLTRLARQHRLIDRQLEDLGRRQEEFSTVTGSMREGLILLNEQGVILSINPAAARLFAADDTCVGRDFLVLERSRSVDKALRDARQQGHSEITLQRQGKVYQLAVSRIGSPAQPTGLVLLTFDVTERVFAERNRQEFTANVSHELKTPLHAILGSAELLENGLVQPPDIPRFAGRIRSEAARLVALINDLLGLSRLEEGTLPPSETFDLFALLTETADALAPAAQAGGVALTLTGQAMTVHGPRQLYLEILRNLCDNAVKYTPAGGSVSLSLVLQGERRLLTVRDTGMGIAPEDQSRIFERFYRGDKSHSRQLEGTGLGLAIVKHAAQQLGAELSLTSTLGQGTTVTVAFPG